MPDSPRPQSLRTSATRSRFERDPKQKLIRFAVLIVTYLVLVPVSKVADWIGLTPSWLRIAGRAKRRNAVWPERFADYRPTENDVFICTYFKSGTNWLMQMAFQIAHRGHGEFAHIHDQIPWPEVPLRDFAVDLLDDGPRRMSPTGLRIIKTHLSFEKVPYSEAARYIVVLRDPKDVLASSYPFFKGVGLGPLMPSLSRWVDFFLTPGFSEGFWPDHVQGYWSQRQRANLLILKFKEIKKDLPATVRQVSAFMGVELSPEEFELVCAKSDFGYMKTIGDRFATGIMTPLSDASTPLLRTGMQGGSAEVLSPDDRDRIDDCFERALAERGSDLDYDSIATRSEHA